MNKNKHGLSRTIPEPVKRLVRQKCKFGCVVCRSAFYQYDHFDPEFKDANSHTPEGICCLCPTCHQEVTSGRLSRALIKRRLVEIDKADTDPTTPPLDFHNGAECLRIGGIRYSLIPVSLLEVYGETLLASTPSNSSEPGTISARFFSESGKETMRIIQNEVSFKADNWDIQTVGRTIKVRSCPSQVCLEMDVDPPRGIIVKRLDMAYRDVHIFSNENVFCVGKKLTNNYYFWFAAEIEVLASRFRGTAIRIDRPSVLADEWNSVGRASVRRPIFRQRGDKGFLEFRTSGFPNIEFGFFSTAFLRNSDVAMDSYSGILHYDSGISFANMVGDFWLGDTFYKNASISSVRRKFRGAGPLSFHDLAASFF